MYVTSKTLTLETLTASALDVAAQTYGGNLVIDAEQVGPTRYRVKLNARDSRDEGARRSWSGRRGPWTCWHVFRDVFAVWMAWDPDAVIRTGVETYRGKDGFLELFPATAERNIGSQVRPLCLADACDCELDGGRDDLDREEFDYVAHLESI